MSSRCPMWVDSGSPACAACIVVRRDTAASMDALQARRGVDLGRHFVRVVGTTCADAPVCALVIATYGARGW